MSDHDDDDWDEDEKIISKALKDLRNLNIQSDSPVVGRDLREIILGQMELSHALFDRQHRVVHKCSVCGMVFVNSGELAEHSATVHRDTMLQCQSCGRFFGSRQELDAHAAEFHAASRNFSKQTPDEEKETSLLRKADMEEKARRRTRGPYRKSHAA
jgi:uncharacterized C2H2 Zn-finger protein